MGSSSSRAAQPEPPPLERTLTAQAREAITEQMLRQRDLAAKAQEEARHYKQLSSEALDALDTAAEQLEDQKKLAAAAVAGGVLVAGALGAIAATIIARRSSSAVIAQVSQEIVDVRRRAASEAEKLQRFGCADLAKSLVPALDAMDALVAASPSDEGAMLTQRTLHDALHKHGVARIEPSIGDSFDVSLHEAMLADAQAEKGIIASVLRPGYVMHEGERVLRAAQVGVGTRAAAASEDSSSEGGASSS